MRCGKSRVERRSARAQLYALDLFRDYVTHYDAKARSAERRGIDSRSTAYRRTANFLAYQPPPLPVADPSVHTALMLDGFYVAYPSIREHRHLPGAKTEESILLLAIDPVTYQPLHWAIYRRLEDGAAWYSFFAELVALGFAPCYLIHDGHQGITRAAGRYMPEALHQRCLVHMVRNVHKDIGITPKAPLAQQLQSLIYQLVKVRTEYDRTEWETGWRAYRTAYDAARAQDIPITKSLASLHVVLSNAYRRAELFTFLDHPGLPNNTNAIESQNRVLREALGRHRGMTIDKREALVAWILLFRSEPDLRVIQEHTRPMDIHTF